MVAAALLVAALAPSERAAAGASNAELKCSALAGPKSKLPLLTLEGEVPGDFAEFTLTIAQGEWSIALGDQNGRSDRVHVVESWSNRVFTLVVSGQDPLHDLKLYAVPSSVGVTRIPGGRKVKFNAIGEQVPIPGFTGTVSHAAYHHDLKLKCTWQLTI